MTNAAKHSGAKSIRIAWHNAERHVLTIEDDGKGFDPDMLGQPGHSPALGLLIMRGRADLAGARLHVESQPGYGTRIRVEMQ